MTTKPREDMNRIIDLPDDLYRKLHYNLEFSASATREDVRKRWWAFSTAPPRGVGPKTLAAIRGWIDGGPPDGAPISRPWPSKAKREADARAQFDASEGKKSWDAVPREANREVKREVPREAVHVDEDGCDTRNYFARDDEYRACVARAYFGMFSADGNAAVAEAVQLTRAAMARGEDVRAVLHAHRERLADHFDEVWDSEVGIYLTYAFEDVIPPDLGFPRHWLEDCPASRRAEADARARINARG